eukprot:COSAG01_NODE_3_length_63519_cov_1591.007663_5_plen_206_part_00
MSAKKAKKEQEVKQEVNEDVQEEVMDELTEEEAVELVEEAQSDDAKDSEPDPLQVALSEIEGLKASLGEEKDKALRAVAEMENFKRRNQQALVTAKAFALEGFVKELLSALDALDMACTHVGEDTSKEQLLEGVQLTQKQFYTVLDKFDVTVIDTKDKKFDPNFHQAVGQEEKEGVEPDMIINEMQKGYQLHERVLRPSMVMISK